VARTGIWSSRGKTCSLSETIKEQLSSYELPATASAPLDLEQEQEQLQLGLGVAGLWV
jgi:hypothetical protein